MATAQDVAQYFLFLDDQNDGNGISNLKLQKLSYYAQGFHLAIFDKDLFQEHISAWTHGPVVETLYHEFKGNGSSQISVNKNFNPNTLSTDEKELIEEVYDVFGQYSAWKLRDMTHTESPWIDHEAQGGVIPKEALKEYFKTRIAQ